MSSTSIGPTSKFDVFLAHNSADKRQVWVISEKLKQRDLNPWLDEEQIPPGRPFQDEIQKAIPLVKSAAIFLGQQGLGRWQAWELRSLINQCVQRQIPVIPVLLPGVMDLPENLLFLQEYRWVAFSNNLDDEHALNLLQWGITGHQSKTKPLPKEEGTIRPDLNGRLIGDPNSGAIYWIDQGKRRPISNPPVLEYLFVTHNIPNDLDINDVRQGTEITSDHRLIRCGEKNHRLAGGVFFLDSGYNGSYKRLIGSPVVFDKYNFNPGSVRDIDCPALAAIPDGPPIVDYP